MRKSQFSSSNHDPLSWKHRKRFGEELTTQLILVCIGSVVLFGAALVALINWVS